MLAEPKAPKPEPSPEVVPPTAPQSVPPVKTVDPANIQALIEKGLKRNKEQIQKESFYLLPPDKAVLYEKNKMDATTYVFLNFIPGFGLGSYIQGDITFGIIQSITGVVGYGLIIGNYNKWSQKEDFCPSAKYPTCKDMDKADGAYAKFLAGIGSVAVGTIVGLVVPNINVNKYNKTLREALNGYNNLSYSIDPLIIPKAGTITPAVGLALNVRY
jgi:hypothetical protein